MCLCFVRELSHTSALRGCQRRFWRCSLPSAWVPPPIAPYFARDIANKGHERLIRTLRQEILGLRDALRLAQSGQALKPEEQLEQTFELEQKVSDLQRVQQETWEQKERLSRLYEDERSRNLQSATKIRAVMEGVSLWSIDVSCCSRVIRALAVLIDDCFAKSGWLSLEFAASGLMMMCAHGRLLWFDGDKLATVNDFRHQGGEHGFATPHQAAGGPLLACPGLLCSSCLRVGFSPKQCHLLLLLPICYGPALFATL